MVFKKFRNQFYYGNLDVCYHRLACPFVFLLSLLFMYDFLFYFVRKFHGVLSRQIFAIPDPFFLLHLYLKRQIHANLFIIKFWNKLAHMCTMYEVGMHRHKWPCRLKDFTYTQTLSIYVDKMLHSKCFLWIIRDWLVLYGIKNLICNFDLTLFLLFFIR